MKNKSKDFQQYLGSCKVGQKGQIVIPKEVRDMFDIEPGSTVMIMADTRRGIAIQKQSFLSKLADEIFLGNGKKVDSSESEENLQHFAKNIKAALDEDDTDK